MTKNKLSKIFENSKFKAAGTLIALLLFTLVSGLTVFAEECPSNLVLTANPSQFNLGDANSKIKLQISPPGTPLDVWKNYTNATLSLPAGLVNLSDTFKSLLPPFALTSHQYSVNSTAAGSYTANISVFNDSGLECTKSVNVSVVNVKNVSLGIFVSDLTTLKINQAASINVTLNSSGTDPAFNIDENMDSVFINETRVIPSVAGGSLNVSTYTFTPNSCGTNKLITAYARNFDDGAGNIFPTISASDTFDVIGSDLTVLDVALSSLTPVAGTSITAVATVKNENGTGTDSAVNGKVTFYYDIVQDANKIAEANVAGSNGSNVSVNAEASANTTWTVTTAGSHTVIAVVSADNECPTSNNQRSSLTLTASAAPIAETPPSPSGGGGSSGGTSAGTIISVSKEGPSSATKFFVVAAGTSANVRVIDSRIPVTLLQIDVANRVADVEVSVTKLDKEPADKIAEGTGKVYSYLKVDTVNLEDKDVSKAVFRFKVEKAWIEQNNYKQEEVVLARFNDGKWNSLSTVVLLTEDKYITYGAESPGFSTFAILARNAEEKVAASGEKKEEKIEEKKEPEVKPIEEKEEKAEEKKPEVKQGESSVSNNAITGAVVALKDTFVGRHPAAVGTVFAVLVALVVLSLWHKRMGSKGNSVKAASRSKTTGKEKKGNKRKR
ncbi:PGF-pre-PGF domain-containing protein [Candidatus Woesearchaeota archaeon]|nr:PGF-pre-PGF domain-containing protein [Candidatus Woesearchaeota archaeon]